MWLYFLKFVRFSSHVKRKLMKLGLLHKNVNISSHRKGNLVAPTSLSVPVMTKSLIYAQQIIISQAGTMKLDLS